MNNEPIIKKKPKPKKNRMQLKLIIFLLIAIVVLVSIPYYFISQGLKEEVFVLKSFRYDTVGERTFVRHLTEAGTVKPKNIVNIKSGVDGVLEELIVKPGADVLAGDTLAIIDAPRLAKNIQEAQIDITEAESKLNELRITNKIELRNHEVTIKNLKNNIEDARENLSLKESLFEIGVISSKELELAKKQLRNGQVELETKLEQFQLTEEKYILDFKTAEDMLSDAQDYLKELEEKKDNTKVIANSSGKILSSIEEGRAVSYGTELFKIADISSSFIIMEIDENQVGWLEEVQEANVELYNEVVRGEVSYISPETKNSKNGRVVEVHLELDRIPESIRVNSTASVEFELQRRENILYLTRGDYLISGEYSFVYVIDGEKAERKEVIFGQHDGNFIEVLSGLEKGDKIISSSYEEYKEKLEIGIIPEGGRKE